MLWAEDVRQDAGKKKRKTWPFTADDDHSPHAAEQQSNGLSCYLIKLVKDPTRGMRTRARAHVRPLQLLWAHMEEGRED